MFTANELSLFLSGVPSIDMDDWEKHTKVCLYTSCEMARIFCVDCFAEGMHGVWVEP